MAELNQYTFEESGVRRIVGAVRRVESETTSRDLSGGPDYPRSTSGTPINWQLGVNGSGDTTIPAWSCVAVGPVTGTQDGFLATLTPPAGVSGAQYGLTGPNDIPGYGPSGYPSNCAFHLEAGWATYDASGTPSPGDVWVPKVGQFALTKGQTGQAGFTVVQIVDASRNLMLVVPTAAGKSLIRFELFSPINWGVLPTANNAYVCRYSGGVWAPDATTPITVVDWSAISGNYSDWVGIGPVTAGTGLYPATSYPAQAGYQGFAVPMADDPSMYEIVWMEQVARWARVTLASELKSTDTSQPYSAVTDDWQGRNADPKRQGLTITNDGNFYGPQGAVAYVCRDPNDQQWNIVWVQHQAHVIEGTIYSGSFSAGTALATITRAYQGIAPTGNPSIVDPLGAFPNEKVGGWFIAVWSEVGRNYHVIAAEQVGFLFTGTLSSNLASTTSSVTISLTAVASPSPFDLLPSSTSASVSNPLALAGKSGDKVLIFRSGTNAAPVYTLLQVQHHVQTFVTNVEWDGTNLNQYTMDVAVMPNAAEVGPTVIDTPTACSS